MNRLRKMIAMALAIMIAVPVMGSVTGYADTVTVIPTLKNPDYVVGETLASFTIQVTHQGSNPAGKLKDSVIKVNDVANIVSYGDFESNKGTLKVTNVVSEGGVDLNRVKYTLTATGFVLKNDVTIASLTFNMPYNNPDGSTKDSGDQVVKVTVNSNTGNQTPPSGGGNSGNSRYSITRVQSPKRQGNVDVPGTERFNIDSISSGSDASIRQTYFADIKVKYSDANLPAGVSSTSLILDDLGSFTMSTAAGSKAEIKVSNKGYIEVQFTALQYTGNGEKLTFRIDDGSSIQADVIADMPECVTRAEAGSGNTNKPSDDDNETKIESETPYVIVNQYGYGGGTVTAGDTFNLSLTFLNTSDSIDVSNMMITVTMPDDLMLTSSSNTFYVPTLETGKSITKSVQVTAKPAAKAQSHNISVSMKYQYIDHRVSTRRSAETTETIAIPVIQVDRFQVTAVEIPMDIMLEEETSVTVSFVNKGRSEVYNLTASIDGNITNPGQNQNLGNLASGVTGTADFFIKPSEAGQLSGTITIAYEDTNMEEKIATIPYNATVKTMEEMNGGGMIGGGGMFPGGETIPGEGEVMPEDTKPKWPVFAIVGAAILIPAAIVGKKFWDKKRKEREDADL